MVSAWHRAAAHFNDKVSVINYEALRTGRSPFGYWKKCPTGILQRDNYYICKCCQRQVDFENFSPCYCHPAGIHCIDTKKLPQVLGNFVYHDAVRFIIADEVHRCGGLDSLNAEMLIAAKRQNIKVLGLSATAALSPLGMRALGYNLDLHGDKTDRFTGPPRCADGRCQRDMLPNYYRWLNRFGCRRDPVFHGWKWFAGADQQISIMKSIRDSIIPARGVRVCRDDIHGFPECTINPELYDIENANQIDEIYAAMADSLQSLDETAKSDKAPEHPLTKILRARQRIELLKVPIAAELISDDLSKGYSSVTFVNFRQTMQELQKRFPEAALIYGDQSHSERDEHINRFQINEARVILVMSSAGGVGLGLHDLSGNYPRIANVMPDFSAGNMIQIFGRLPRDGGKSKCYYRVLLAAGTIETRIHRAMTAKMNNIAALNDGDMNPLT